MIRALDTEKNRKKYQARGLASFGKILWCGLKSHFLSTALYNLSTGNLVDNYLQINTIHCT